MGPDDTLWIGRRASCTAVPGATGSIIGTGCMAAQVQDTCSLRGCAPFLSFASMARNNEPQGRSVAPHLRHAGSGQTGKCRCRRRQAGRHGGKVGKIPMAVRHSPNPPPYLSFSRLRAPIQLPPSPSSIWLSTIVHQPNPSPSTPSLCSARAAQVSARTMSTWLWQQVYRGRLLSCPADMGHWHALLAARMRPTNRSPPSLVAIPPAGLENELITVSCCNAKGETKASKYNLAGPQPETWAQSTCWETGPVHLGECCSLRMRSVRSPNGSMSCPPFSSLLPAHPRCRRGERRRRSGAKGDAQRSVDVDRGHWPMSGGSQARRRLCAPWLAGDAAHRRHKGDAIPTYPQFVDEIRHIAACLPCVWRRLYVLCRKTSHVSAGRPG